jgi:hypothetical protein
LLPPEASLRGVAKYEARQSNEYKLSHESAGDCFVVPSRNDAMLRIVMLPARCH